MKRPLLMAVTLAVAFGAASASALNVTYGGWWGRPGSALGSFNEPEGVALTSNGYIYVAELEGDRIQYFSAPNVVQGHWPCNDAYGLACASGGHIYATNFSLSQLLKYTTAGTFVTSFPAPFIYSGGVECAADGTVYAADLGNDCVRFFTSTGSEIGSFGYDCLDMPVGLEIAGNGNVYATGHLNDCVAYFTSSGSTLGSWHLFNPGDISMSPVDGTIFVSCVSANLVYYYTSTGSLLGSFGGPGSGPGEFDNPAGIAVTRDGTRVYVADRYNHRVQYFELNYPAVSPASLGKVKALFR